ncbi:MAG: sodium:calcium antiporter [Aquabacterium sp.]|jgi:cation:H+ antiporter|nr:sodium:calcium antiporter [Aquabacterium sp.]KLR59166.1 cation transporter [Diaphorobacter sp. J5-51]OGA80207.1 MAG: cation transporter [Burkholderiales bacterium RIFCSPHIGHO2_01_FULL_63_240]OGB03776.1 MAG: cation transporter [Burkholderiales bacterium RIFCSPHIGHO2_12_FULL_63_20]OGB64901.1 MAG: cation transporter [Burkholderiales bacterium RIFCSPLOWO2_12_FULL_64_99]MDD2977122.1 sodium:calcium antiporter [Aquabacterium sp.]
MTSSALVWIEFIACMALIGVAGSRLIRYGDAIAELAGLSRSWVGLILVATVTSLPELVTGLSAVTVAQAPDIAVGDALGSAVFNLTILAFVDVFYRKESVYAIASRGHVLSASLGVMLLTAAALILTLSTQKSMPSLGHISVGSVVLMGLYTLAMRLIYVNEQRHHQAAAATASSLSLKSALMGYAMAAVVIVGSGIWLPLLGVELARIMGWSNSFVGTLFVAMATSVPEVATTVAALRIGAVDLAIGNLLGSNLFDVLILAVDDVAYRAGPLYELVSPLHTVSALTAATMSGAVVVALVFRPASRVLRLGSWASVVLLTLYLLNAFVQFWHGR